MLTPPPDSPKDKIISFLLPAIVFAAFFILSVVIMPIPYWGQIRPDFFLMLVYFWAIYRPSFFPIWLIFALGLLVDLLVAGLIGLTPFLLIIAFLVVRGQRRFLMGQSFWVQWLCFSLVGFFYILLDWGLMHLVFFRWDWDVTYLIRFVMNVCFFPVIAFVLVKIHRLLSSTEQR